MSQTSVQIRKMPVSTQICIILLCLIINFVNICLGVYSLIFKLVVFLKIQLLFIQKTTPESDSAVPAVSYLHLSNRTQPGWEAAASGGGEGPSSAADEV